MSASPTNDAEAREDRIRVMLGIGVAVVILLALSCCCLGAAMVGATDDGHQTRARHHGR